MAPAADAVPQALDSGELSFELDLAALDDAMPVDAQSLAGEAPDRVPHPAFDLFATEPIALDLPAAEPELEAAPAPLAEVMADDAQGGPWPVEDDEQIKRVGDLRIGIPLFNIYLNEADELSRRLATELAEWSMELHRPVGESAAALAHSLAGSSATVGFADLSQLSRALEHALLRSDARGHGDAEEVQLYVDVAEEIRRLLHQFAAGFLKTPRPGLLERLAEHEIDADRRQQAHGGAPAGESTPAEHFDAESAAGSQPAAPAEATSQFGPFGLSDLKSLADLPEPMSGPPREGVDDSDDAIEAIDAVDAELFPIFEEEGRELLPQLAARLRDWTHSPADPAAPAAAMRALHTLKGGRAPGRRDATR